MGDARIGLRGQPRAVKARPSQEEPESRQACLIKPPIVVQRIPPPGIISGWGAQGGLSARRPRWLQVQKWEVSYG